MRPAEATQSYEHSLVKVLRAVPSFSALDDRTLLAIVGDSANLFWREGRAIFEHGSAADALYVVLSGSVRVVEADGRQLGVLGPGDFFGEFSLLLGADHLQTVETVEPSELLVIPKERFDRLLADHPALAEDVRARAEERQAANTADAAPMRTSSRTKPR